MYPAVAGHEIVSTVTALGSAATKFKVGDTVGLGCLVESCRTCASCREGLEQYCDSCAISTYIGMDPILGGPTLGGYSRKIGSFLSRDFGVSIS